MLKTIALMAFAQAGQDLSLEETWWKETNAPQRREKYHCENLASDYYRVAMDVRKHDVPLSDKLLLPYAALYHNVENTCWWEGGSEHWYHGCTDMQYDLINNAIIEMKEHVKDDYLKQDQIAMATKELFKRTDHCVKAFSQDIEDVLGDNLLEMLDEEDLEELATMGHLSFI